MEESESQNRWMKRDKERESENIFCLSRFSYFSLEDTTTLLLLLFYPCNWPLHEETKQKKLFEHSIVPVLKAAVSLRTKFAIKNVETIV